MLQAEKTTIDGVGYEVTQLPYKRGQRVLLRLYKTLGPALAEALANAPEIKKGAKLSEVDVRTIAPALSAAVQSLADNLSETEFETLVDTLAEYTKISTEADKWVPLKGVLDLHFAGKYLQLFQWLGFALRVNYLGFTIGQGWPNLLEAAMERVRASQSQDTLTGTSTGSQAPSNTLAL